MKKIRSKFFALLLVFAMLAGSFSGQYVQGAKKKPKFSTKKLQITVGSTKKLKVKNGKGYKLSWKVKNKKIVSLKKNGKYGKKVRAKKAGSTTITCKLKKKGKTKKTLKCTVKVVKKKKTTPAPQTPQTESPVTQVPDNVVATPIPDTQASSQPEPTKKPSPTADPNFTPVEYKSGSFETGTDGFTARGGQETLSVSSSGYSGKGLSITGRQQSWQGASLDLTDTVQRSAVYQVSAWIKQSSGSTQSMKVSCALNSGGDTTYPEVGTVEAKSGEWTKFEATYVAPKSFSSLSIYFESVTGTFDFMVDEFSMIQVSAGIVLPDAASLPSIKEAYEDIFEYVGTCLSYQGYTSGNQLSDNNLMSLVTKHYNSFTLENEMKPDAILSGNSTISVATAKGSTYHYIIPDNYTEDTVPVLNFNNIDRALEIAYQKGIKMRGHTLLWHQQTPVKFFKAGYSSNGANVSVATMNARLEFFVRTVMAHVLEKEKELTGSAGSIVYAWDIVNEYTHRDNDPTATSWVDIYGDMGNTPTYVKDAYTYAYDELENAGVEDSVTLFLNDYNTYEVADRLVNIIEYINSDGIICKGVGMQAHLDVDYPTVDSVARTIDTFKAAGLEIQITELDVTINYPRGSYNASLKKTDTDQANFLYDLMTMIIEKKQNGANITGITFWGLYDTVSWRGNYAPLLFSSGMNDPKESFYKVIEAAGVES